MNIMLLRTILSVVAITIVSALAILVLFFGAALNTVQVGLLTLLAGALIAEVKTASSYLFDGTPNKETPP